MNVVDDNDDNNSGVGSSNNRNDRTGSRDEYDRYDLKVYVTSVDASDITSRLNGYFTLDGAKIRFKGIAFGRIGGHNVHVKISKRAEAMIRRMGYDPEHVLVAVQRKMVEGDTTIDQK